MKKHYFLTIAGCWLFIPLCWAQLDASQVIKWDSEVLADGLVLRTFQADLGDQPQAIQLLEVDLRKRDLTLVYSHPQHRPTSEIAQSANGLAAINAGFFDIKNGGSVTYIKVDGALPPADTTKWGTTDILNGALIITKKGKLAMEPAGSTAAYTQDRKIDDVLVTGSLLIDEGTALTLPDKPFVNDRHPRTCVGILDKHRVLLVTIDGRAAQATGMTLPELTNFMRSLGCREAINLDGGGSTTMWVAKGQKGVVNHPSDNKVFDHLGERPVSNILLVK